MTTAVHFTYDERIKVATAIDLRIKEVKKRFERFGDDEQGTDEDTIDILTSAYAKLIGAAK